jgi:hypothetical protein
MTQTLAAFSQSISRLAAAAAPLLTAIRIAPNRHMTGLLREGGVIVTVDQALPALDSYTVLLPQGHLAESRPGPRNSDHNLAILHLRTPWQVTDPPVANPEVGGIVLLVAADADASPTVRLTVVHRLLRTPDGPAAVLDVTSHGIDLGSLVLDAGGGLIGLASLGPNGEVMAIPAATIARMPIPDLTLAPPPAAQPPPPPTAGRGWLGLALQPITVPDVLVAQTGQTSARMVVSITRGGPAEKAGLRVGDVLLALNGTGATGAHALRAFLATERIGSSVEVKLLRDGAMLTTHLTVAAQPTQDQPLIG